MIALIFGAKELSAAPPVPEGALRIATFNMSLNRDGPGVLARELETAPSRQAQAAVSVLRQVRPDIVLLNEVDYDPEGKALDALAELLAAPGELLPLDYPYRFAGPVNTGQPTGLDLDGDGRTDGPADAQGFGRFPGQYGMVILSRMPIDTEAARTFRTVRWQEMPENQLPLAYYRDTAPALFLSSKAHWDVPVRVGDRRLHLLASHPTPPVFDGPEDRNGRRNADEIRFWQLYLDDEERVFPVDDDGSAGGFAGDAPFVILGDLNADPLDGSGIAEAIAALLADPRVQDPLPASTGGRAASLSQGYANARHRGDPTLDTADWRDRPGPGNLRVDYVLPAAGLEVLGAGVFWPDLGEPGALEAKAASDHRLVWVDVVLP